MLKLSSLLLVACVLSCQSNETNDSYSGAKLENESYIASHNATTKISIEGMTCEIGCVRTVKSHLSKMKGVLRINMDFDTSRTVDYSIVEFDTNLISENDMKVEIESIANGIYSVINTDTN